MPDFFTALATGTTLPTIAAESLRDRGFVVVPGPYEGNRMPAVAAAYAAAESSATGDDIRVGSTSTRVSDYVNRGAEFDELYLFPPLLAAACRVIGRPFKLSSLQSRTLRPGASDQGVHVDVRRHTADWPLLGFVLMIDEFRADNGATRFMPGSHLLPDGAEDNIPQARGQPEGQVPASGPAGSLLIFNGSTWHGHGPNTSGAARRSLQGAFIPRAGRAGTDFAARMQPGTRARLGSLAHYLLAL